MLSNNQSKSSILQLEDITVKENKLLLFTIAEQMVNLRAHKHSHVSQQI